MVRATIVNSSLFGPALTERRPEEASKVNTITETPGAVAKPEEKLDEITEQDNPDSVVKHKLVDLLMSSKNEVIGRMHRVNSIHDVYKADKMYKTGYLVSFANKLYQRLLMMYADVEKQKFTLSTLQILDYYEEVRDAIEDLRGVLQVLNMVITSNLQILKDVEGTRLRKNAKNKKNGKFHSYKHPTAGAEKKYGYNPDISWSYYDESLLK